MINVLFPKKMSYLHFFNKRAFTSQFDGRKDFEFDLHDLVPKDEKVVTK